MTLKTRLGWDDESRNAAELARRAEAAGVAMITVHGRTRCQFYQGAADWSAVRAVVEAVAIPVVVNGDAQVVGDARAMLAASGAAAVMIGRGAIGAPWRVGAIARALETGGPLVEPSPASQRADALEHLESLLARMGARKACATRANISPHMRSKRAPERSFAGGSLPCDDAAEARDLLAAAFDPVDMRTAA